MFYDFFERDILKINSKVNFWCEWYFLWFLWIHFLLSVYLIEFLLLNSLVKYLIDCIWEISLTNIIGVNSLLTELFEWFLCFFKYFSDSILSCVYFLFVFEWRAFFEEIFLLYVFLWIFWVIIFWVFCKRVLCYEEIIILALNIFYEWLIRGFIILLCIIHYFYFLWEKEDFCGINFSEEIFLEIILMDVSLLFRSIVENFFEEF